MIEVRNLSKSFDDKLVLNKINAKFEKGKTNLVIGQSGSGKTVLLKCLIGLYEPDEGDILFDNVPVNEMNSNTKKQIRQALGMVFQGGALFDTMNIEENVMFPLSMFTKMNKSDKLERVNFCLKRVNLENVNHLTPSELSGGMKKRVAIARAIAMNPKYLFCDEPNSGLDPKTAVVIDSLIKEITEEYNITTIINTHDMNSVLELGDTVNFIYKGQNWWTGNKNNIIQADNKELKDLVYASKILRDFVKK
ncbi:MAG: ATP-binding cassette domain-containing protein [Bacteroidota bacterium]|nr:ATP-binding cassette domain-containing protein [Bacteroidota bacterium]